MGENYNIINSYIEMLEETVSLKNMSSSLITNVNFRKK